MKSKLEPIYQTDLGNSLEFVNRHKDIVRYSTDERCFYIWSGKQWKPDTSNSSRVCQLIGDMAKEKYDDVRHADLDPEDFADAIRWPKYWGSARGIANLVTLLKTNAEISCTSIDFNLHPNYINTRNGMLNLDTGKLESHDPAFMFSYMAPVEFFADAKYHDLDKFLDTITKDQAGLKEFLQVSLGYSMFGNKPEERVFLPYGLGGTGKGTLFSSFENVLGEDYVIRVNPQSIMEQKRNSSAASSDIARMENKRVVIVSEPKKGDRLEEGMMKAISGRDGIVARSLYVGDKNIKSTMQFWIQSNHRVKFDAKDTGNKRRYLEIPFNNVIPEKERDTTLKDRFADTPAFREAFFAWLVAGAVKWKNNSGGLNHYLDLCPAVIDATEQLFESNDFLGGFLKTRFKKWDGDAKTKMDYLVPVSVMWDEYEAYCRDLEQDAAKKNNFNKILKDEYHFEQKQSKKATGTNVYCWVGLRLLTEKDEVKPSVVIKPPAATTKPSVVEEDEEDFFAPFKPEFGKKAVA